MPFVNDEVAGAYERSQRFDESHFSYEAEYAEASDRRMKAEMAIYENFSPEQIQLVNALVDAIFDGLELECRHYFEQGYTMA